MPAPAKKTDEGAVPVTLTLAGPPVGQYAKGPMISFRGSLDEVIEMTAEFFDSESVVDDLRATFQLGRATTVVAAGLDATPVQATPPPPPTPIRKADSPIPGAVATCPECGKGQLVKKNRKDGSGTFTGCNNFPNCRYIAKGK